MPNDVSADVAAGTDATAAAFNLLRDDVVRHGQNDMFKGYPNTSQLISDTTWTDVEWAFEDFDNNALHDTGVNPEDVTIQNDGIYELFYVLHFAYDATGYRNSRFVVNGSAQDGECRAITDPATGSSRMIHRTVVELSASDIVGAQVWQNTGGNLNLVSLAGNLGMFIVKQLS